MATPQPWTRRDAAALGAVLVLGVAIRLALLPTRGFADDIDQFVGWVRHIATHGLGTLYGETEAGPVTFGPVMGYIWAVLATVEPGFRTAVDASEVGIRVPMKLPAVAADLGLALIVAYTLRGERRWAVVGAAAILLHPAVVDLSAWWGQYESVYMAFALGAAVLAINQHNRLAALAIAVALMTKPQVLPLLLPFAAWIWATGGWREVLRAAVLGAATILVLWLPFLSNGGPFDYLRNLATYQDEIFNVLSLRAWNAWWLVQEAAAGGQFLADDVAVFGPVTLRHLGYLMAGGLSIAVAVVLVRNPRPRTLVMALASTTLIAFAFLTQIHERYAYGALVFLALLVAEPAIRWLALAFGVVFTLNLLAAIPPTPEIGTLLPVAGVLGIAGSVAMLAITFSAVRMMAASPPDPVGAPAPPAP